MPPVTQYNADACFRSVKVQNELLDFTDDERMEVYRAFKTGYIKGHMIIVAIRARKLERLATA